MELSKYVHLINSNGKFALYNALTTKLIQISKDQYEKLNEGQSVDKIFDEEQKHLLVKKGFSSENEDMLINNIIKGNKQELPDVFAVYLILTEECNMHCEYCSQSAFRIRQRMGSMSPEIVEKSLELFYKTQTKRNRTIVLYGGEPTINRPGIKTALNYIRNVKGDKNAEIIIFTNGILIDEEYADLFKAHNVKVILSIDGPQPINDKYRLCYNCGSFEKICKAATLLKNNGIVFGLSSTIASHNINQLENIVDYFIEEFKPFSIGLNPLHYVPGNRESISVTEEQMALKMIDAYKHAREKGVYVEQIMRRVRPFVLSQPRLKDCPSCGGMIRILPDGSFGPCGHFMEEEAERSKTDYDIEKSELIKKWNTRISCNMDNCSECRALGLCGGGCPYNSFKHGGHIFTSNDERSCVQAKYFLEWMIGELLQNQSQEGFYEFTEKDKLAILGNINLDRYIPLEKYSRYGEFVIDEQYR